MKSHLPPNVDSGFSVYFVDTEAETARHLESQLLYHFPE